MTSQWNSIVEIAESVRAGRVSALSMVEKSLSLIRETEGYSAIISILEERAINRAKEIDTLVTAKKDVGRLAGVPFIAKDNILSFGGRTTAASNMLRSFEAPYQATVIERLESEGAICVAKANLDAFAHGSSTENSDFMITKNPKDQTRVPGGSSGGSAAAVALQVAPFALGTDTGGSISQPSSFCGVVGYKPTYGLVSRSGVVAMGSSLDVVGPLTRSVEDAALVLECMSGIDPLDATSIAKESTYQNLETGLISRSTFGVIKEFMGEGVDPEVKSIIVKAVENIQFQGGRIKEVSLPSLPVSLAAYYIICPAEVSSNLSRYDGQRYGFSSSDAADLEDSYVKSRSEGFGDEAKRRIIMGTFVLSSGYYDAYYQRAQLVRSKIINEYNKALKDCDVLIGPVAPTPAFKIGQNTSNPLNMYLSDAMTVGANLAGTPAISIPLSETKGGLPVGLQLVASGRNDKKLLSLASEIERNVL